MNLWKSKNGKWALQSWNDQTIAVIGEFRNYEAFSYGDGRIAYDIPEAIPAYVKAQVVRQFRKAGALYPFISRARTGHVSGR